jgi:hypothetical protein
MKDPKSQTNKSIPSGIGGRTPETQSRIDQQLRAMHDDVVQQGIPEDFFELISRLADSANEERRPERTIQQKRNNGPSSRS